jgi:hypothetical protein
MFEEWASCCMLLCAVQVKVQETAEEQAARLEAYARGLEAGAQQQQQQFLHVQQAGAQQVQLLQLQQPAPPSPAGSEQSTTGVPW